MRKIFLVSAILLSGCAAGVDQAPLPPPPSQALVAAQGFVVNGVIPENHADFPMYAMIALSDHNKSGNRKRNRWVCETFSNLPSLAVLQGQGLGSVSSSRITPTYWLLSEDTDRNDCEALLARYDFDRAKAVFSLSGRAGETGPMLMAVQGNDVAVLDISRAKKKWVRAMVAKWSEAVRAADGGDITVESGPIADTCALLTGNEARRVQASVYKVVGEDIEGATPWYQSLVNTARTFATELLPFGNKVENLANRTCDEVNQNSSLT